MTRQLRYWPDKLREPRWRRRCRFIGLDRVEDILASARPIVLVTLHYGNLTELYFWIRACGIGVVVLANRPTAVRAFRAELDLAADRANGLDGVPGIVGTDYLRLWRALEILRQPNRVLAVAMEDHRRRAVTTRGPGYSLRLSPGALHIAAMAGAAVVPCLMTVEKHFDATLFFGTPLPDELVADRERHGMACQKILEQLGPRIAARPEQSATRLIRALSFDNDRTSQDCPRRLAL